MKKLFILFIPLLLLSCDQKKDQTTEQQEYNALFVYPAGGEDPKVVYVGTVKGLSSCKYVVGQYYFKRRALLKEKWDYVCCLRTKDNECEEEHKYEE